MDKSTPTRRKRTQRDYTMGFKLAVVEQVEKGQITYKQAQRHYGIQGRSIEWDSFDISCAMPDPTEAPNSRHVCPNF